MAILGTDDFDAATVDMATVTLGESLTVGVTVKKNGRLQAALEDVNDDGDLDLVMRFGLNTLVANGDVTAETTQLCLNGLTLEGMELNGCDAVTVLSRRR